MHFDLIQPINFVNFSNKNFIFNFINNIIIIGLNIYKYITIYTN